MGIMKSKLRERFRTEKVISASDSTRAENKMHASSTEGVLGCRKERTGGAIQSPGNGREVKLLDELTRSGGLKKGRELSWIVGNKKQKFFI